MMQQDKDKTIACLDAKEKEEFEEALVKLEIELLQEKTKKVVIEV